DRRHRRGQRRGHRGTRIPQRAHCRSDPGHLAGARLGRGHAGALQPGRAAQEHPTGVESRVSSYVTPGHDDRDETVTSSPAPETRNAVLARVYALLLARAGETQVELPLDATRRACEVLGDIHTAAPTITVTGTNGKTSTARMIDS